MQCISQFQQCPYPPGYCGAFSHTFHPGGRALAFHPITPGHLTISLLSSHNIVVSFNQTFRRTYRCSDVSVSWIKMCVYLNEYELLALPSVVGRYKTCTIRGSLRTNCSLRNEARKSRDPNERVSFIETKARSKRLQLICFNIRSIFLKEVERC